MKVTRELERIEFFDVMRTGCMVWIVIFWHGNFLDGNSPAWNCVTIGVLVMFTFISGYLGGLGKAEDALYYYKKKFFRFFPILIMSCVSLYLMYRMNTSFGFITSPFQLFCSITGLACFMGNMPLTVWYFDMIIIFYILTPWICKCINFKSQIGICVLLYLLLYCGYIWGKTDKRLLIYFPYYFGGLIWCRQEINYIDLKKKHLSILSFSVIITVVLLLLSFRIENTILFQAIVALFICIAGIEISKFIQKISWIKKICRYVSTASLFTYFFHRQFIGISMLLINEYIGWKTGRLMYFILAIMLIVICYFVQIFYNNMIKKVI